MNLYKSSLFTVILLCIHVFSLSANTKSATLPEPLHQLLKTAFANNPELASKRHSYEALKKQVPAASALPNPTIQITEFVESVQTRTGPQERAFVFSQKLPWFGKLDKKEQALLQKAKVEWYHVKGFELELFEKLSHRYFDYAYNQEAINITTENLSLLRSLEPVVNEEVRTGANLNSLIKLKVEVGKLEDKLASLKQKKVMLLSKLDELIGTKNSGYSTPDQWEPPVIEIKSQQLFLAKVEQNHPDLQKVKSRIQALNTEHESAKLASYPDFHLGLNYIQVGDSNISSFSDSGNDPWGITFALDLPIWSSKNKALRQSSNEAIRSSEKTFTEVKNQLSSKFTIASALLSDANRKIELYGKDLVKLAEQAVENSRTAYQAGSENILDLIDSERTLLDLKLLYRKAISETWKAQVTLQSLSGNL